LKNWQKNKTIKQQYATSNMLYRTNITDKKKITIEDDEKDLENSKNKCEVFVGYLSWFQHPWFSLREIKKKKKKR
jgi:hypothetical protein